MDAQTIKYLKKISDDVYQAWTDLVDLDDGSLDGLPDDARSDLLSASDHLDRARMKIDELTERNEA